MAIEEQLISCKRGPVKKNNTSLKAEIARLKKIITVLMDRAEQELVGKSDYSLFQTEIVLREQVRIRTTELENALKENERIMFKLRKSEELFQQLVQQSMVGIAMTDSTRFLYANPLFAEMTGYTVEELCQLGPLDIIPAEERPEIDQIIKQRFSGELGRTTYLMNIARKDGSIITVEISGSPLIFTGGVPVLISAFIDVTKKITAEKEITALNQKLKEQAIRDPLTGLYNRRFMEKAIARELYLAEKKGQTVCVIMGDLDYFKKINDTYGHQVGDKALQFFGELIKANTRNSDISCRYGGEEFLLLLPNISYRNAIRRAEAIRSKLSRTPFIFNESTAFLNASFGVAAFPDDAGEGISLISTADRALYMAKERGRNCVCSASGQQ